MNFKTMMTPMNMALAGTYGMAIIGSILNALGNILCFPIWLVCNFVFAYVSYRDKNQWMVLIFITYFITSVLGLIQWQ